MEKPIRVVIDTDRPGAMINANIYGHFTEHLGTLVYNGIWVGPIPQFRMLMEFDPM